MFHDIVPVLDNQFSICNLMFMCLVGYVGNGQWLVI